MLARTGPSFALLLLAGSLSSIGCGGGLPCPLYPHTDAREALEQHAAIRSGLRSIQAEARVDQRGRQGRVRGTVLMFVEQPDRVRLDAMTQFGPAVILTSSDGRFQFTDLRKNRFLQGATCAANIERLLGLRLSAAETTALLLGAPSLLPGASARIRCTGDGLYRVALRAADGRRQHIDFSYLEKDLKAPPSRQRLRLLRSELFGADGATVWRISYGDYRVIGMAKKTVAMPFLVRVEQPQAGSDLLVRFQSIEANPLIPLSAFSQEARPGISVEEAPCDRR